ncbi:with coiled-coil, ANK repeat and PH domain-containing protein [Seminavis robusta]|uniref:With coiled-coil, ANK repeat and PH domain-containing protein n=1 Tax=Seminavis robusta TaxID=568900 RepID=A0A9N8DK53_9STRA|nr:with coiled-coil, ANK repeat and PH domain-containing protein [Seminavis robusta]|eukprot:Sro124_g060030.1 with coiled-coil, ANK repeat and PH domain-containing protein (1273) ;mRNA; r:105966-109784
MDATDDQVRLLRHVEGLVKKVPGNLVCAECPERHPTWASLIQPAVKGGSRMGVFVCQQCYQHHYALGRSLCEVKSLSLASEWASDDLDILAKTGNQVVNSIYEASEGWEDEKEIITFDKDQESKLRLAYIKNKYHERKYFSEDKFNEIQVGLSPIFQKILDRKNGTNNNNNNPQEADAVPPTPRKKNRRRFSLTGGVCKSLTPDVLKPTKKKQQQQPEMIDPAIGATPKRSSQKGKAPPSLAILIADTTNTAKSRASSPLSQGGISIPETPRRRGRRASSNNNEHENDTAGQQKRPLAIDLDDATTDSRDDKQKSPLEEAEEKSVGARQMLGLNGKTPSERSLVVGSSNSTKRRSLEGERSASVRNVHDDDSRRGMLSKSSSHRDLNDDNSSHHHRHMMMQMPTHYNNNQNNSQRPRLGRRSFSHRDMDEDGSHKSHLSRRRESLVHNNNNKRQLSRRSLLAANKSPSDRNVSSKSMREHRTVDRSISRSRDGTRNNNNAIPSGSLRGARRTTSNDGMEGSLRGSRRTKSFESLEGSSMRGSRRGAGGDALEGSVRGSRRAGAEPLLEGSVRGSRRAAGDALEGSVRGSRRAGAESFEGSMRGSRRTAGEAVDGSVRGSRRTAAEPLLEGSVRGSRRTAAEPLDGSVRGSRRTAAEPLDGSVRGSRRTAAEPLDGSSNGSVRGSRRTAAEPLDGSVRGSRRTAETSLRGSTARVRDRMDSSGRKERRMLDGSGRRERTAETSSRRERTKSGSASRPRRRSISPQPNEEPDMNWQQKPSSPNSKRRAKSKDHDPLGRGSDHSKRRSRSSLKDDLKKSSDHVRKSGGGTRRVNRRERTTTARKSKSPSRRKTISIDIPRDEEQADGKWKTPKRCGTTGGLMDDRSDPTGLRRSPMDASAGSNCSDSNEKRSSGGSKSSVQRTKSKQKSSSSDKLKKRISEPLRDSSEGKGGKKGTSRVRRSKSDPLGESSTDDDDTDSEPEKRSSRDDKKPMKTTPSNKQLNMRPSSKKVMRSNSTSKLVDSELETETESNAEKANIKQNGRKEPSSRPISRSQSASSLGDDGVKKSGRRGKKKDEKKSSGKYKHLDSSVGCLGALIVGSREGNCNGIGKNAAADAVRAAAAGRSPIRKSSTMTALDLLAMNETPSKRASAVFDLKNYNYKNAMVSQWIKLPKADEEDETASKDKDDTSEPKLKKSLPSRSSVIVNPLLTMAVPTPTSIDKQADAKSGLKRHAIPKRQKSSPAPGTKTAAKKPVIDKMKQDSFEDAVVSQWLKA